MNEAHGIANRHNEAKMMKQKLPWCLLATLLLTTAPTSEAQQSTKVPRIGFLTGASLSSQFARNEAFRQGLRELGYVEGKNIVIEWRSYRGNSIVSPRSPPSWCVSR